MPATGASQIKSLCQRCSAASSVGAPAREHLNDNFIISAISVSQPVNTPSSGRQRGPVINSKPNFWYFFSLLIFFIAQGSFFVFLFFLYRHLNDDKLNLFLQLKKHVQYTFENSFPSKTTFVLFVVSRCLY